MGSGLYLQNKNDLTVVHVSAEDHAHPVIHPLAFTDLDTYSPQSYISLWIV